MLHNFFVTEVMLQNYFATEIMLQELLLQRHRVVTAELEEAVDMDAGATAGRRRRGTAGDGGRSSRIGVPRRDGRCSLAASSSRAADTQHPGCWLLARRLRNDKRRSLREVAESHVATPLSHGGSDGRCAWSPDWQ